MYLQAVVVNVIAFMLAFSFYFRRRRQQPFLKIASLYNYVLWIVTAVFAWQFMISASLISPFYEFIRFVIIVVVIECIVNIAMHVLERFVGEESKRNN